MKHLHKGYEYQDLVAAFLIASNLHRNNFKIATEFKENEKDYFDDIVLVCDEFKVKVQVKHSEKGTIFSKKDFIDSSDSMVKSYLGGDSVRYLLITNRKLELAPFFKKGKKSEFLPIKNKSYIVDQGKFEEGDFWNYFKINSSLPNASIDLSEPGDFENLLFELLIYNLGIGHYPNDDIEVKDVANRLLMIVKNNRSTTNGFISKKDIIRKLDLDFEFGHIKQKFPFVASNFRIRREDVVKEIKDSIFDKNFIILKGQPGVGKSHIFDDLYKDIEKDKDTIVLRHFCYLEPGDSFVKERLDNNVMYGNFIYQLEDKAPQIVEKIRPRFAATKSNLEDILIDLSESDKKVLLMVDGLDHISRVVSQNNLSKEIVNNFVRGLSEIKLPEQVSIFISSQPSVELRSLMKEKEHIEFKLEPWDNNLISDFVIKFNSVLPKNREVEPSKELLTILKKKSEGNPLYLMYIFNSIKDHKEDNFELFNFLENLPKLNNDLSNYYSYLMESVNASEMPIVQTLALLDFSVLKKELKEMFHPIEMDAIHKTLKKINPLMKSSVSGGISIYHESFRRFIIEGSLKEGSQKNIYDHIIDWLKKKGFFDSYRSFRYLISYLIRSDRSDDIYDLLTKDFITQGLFNFYPIEVIENNLEKIANFSSSEKRWDMYSKAVELKRSLHTASEEHLLSYLHNLYLETAIEVLGADLVAKRMLFDDEIVFSKKYGIKICRLLEHKGASPPWRFYDVSGLQFETEDSYDYYDIAISHFLNLSKKYSFKEALSLMKEMIENNPFSVNKQYFIDSLLEELDFVFDDLMSYFERILQLNLSKENSLYLYLGIAKFIRNKDYDKSCELASKVLKESKNIDQVLNAILLEGDLSLLELDCDLTNLTKKIINLDIHNDEEESSLRKWYKYVRIIAHKDLEVIEDVKQLIPDKNGWYIAWLKFVCNLSVLEVSNKSKDKVESEMRRALEKLYYKSHPFVGDPRAMDLYSINDLSKDSFDRVIKKAKDFSNYKDILELLFKISNRSTSHLQGSSGGPITGETLNKILKNNYRFLKDENKELTNKLLKKNIKKSVGYSVYYSSSAEQNLEFSKILSLNGEHEKATEWFKKACRHIGAYGMRKDVTIFELIDSISFIIDKDDKSSVDLISDAFVLSNIVTIKTDGKETNWALPVLLKKIIDKNLKLGVCVIKQTVANYSKDDWRILHVIDYLCGELVKEDSIDVYKVLDIYKSFYQSDNIDFKVDTGLKIVKRLLDENDNDKAQDFLNFLASGLYILDKVEYVRNEDNFKKIINFVKKYDLDLKDKYKEFIRIKAENQKDINKSNFNKENKKINFNDLSVSKVRSLVNSSDRRMLLNSKNANNFALFLLDSEELSKEKIKSLLLEVARPGIYGRRTKGLVEIRDLFVEYEEYNLAAFVSMIGFVHIRGGGWNYLADEEYNYLGVEAFDFDKKEAEKIMSSELSYLFESSSYFNGIVKHIIPFLVEMDRDNLANRVWKEAYEVINYRLPIDKDQAKDLKMMSPTEYCNLSNSLDFLIDPLVEIAKT